MLQHSRKDKAETAAKRPYRRLLDPKLHHVVFAAPASQFVRQQLFPLSSSSWKNRGVCELRRFQLSFRPDILNLSRNFNVVGDILFLLAYEGETLRSLSPKEWYVFTSTSDKSQSGTSTPTRIYFEHMSARPLIAFHLSRSWRVSTVSPDKCITL